MSKRKKRDLPIGGVQRYEIAVRKLGGIGTRDAHIARQSQNRYVIGGDVPTNVIRVWSTFAMAEACIKACFKGCDIRLA